LNVILSLPKYWRSNCQLSPNSE